MNQPNIVIHTQFPANVTRDQMVEHANQILSSVDQIAGKPSEYSVYSAHVPVSGQTGFASEQDVEAGPKDEGI